MIRLSLSKFLIAGAAGLPLFAAYGQPAASLMPGTIVVDGTAEEAWDSAESYNLSEDLLETSPDPANFAVSWKGMWDEDNLYLLVSVTDATPTAYDPVPLDLSQLDPFEVPPDFLRFIVENIDRVTSNFWEYDATQLFLDPDLSAGDSFDGVDDTQILLPHDGTSPEFPADPLALEEAIVSAASADGPDAVIELALPWTALNVTAEAGTQFGLQLVSSDQINEEGAIELGHQLAFGPSGNMSMPADFQVVELLPAFRPAEDGEVPVALLDSSAAILELEELTLFESEWFGLYSVMTGTEDVSVIQTRFLGALNFLDGSPSTAVWMYSDYFGTWLFTSETAFSSGMVFSLLHDSWLYLHPDNVTASSIIRVYHYGLGQWLELGPAS